MAARIRDPEKEIWRLIPSLPGVLASSHGRLMVVPYAALSGRADSLRQYGGDPTRGQWDGVRYIYTLHGRTHKVARLVCEAFSGKPPFERAVAMHLDENSRNNNARNLKWGTQKENLNAPGFIEYCKGRTGPNSPTVKARAARNALLTGELHEHSPRT